MHLYSVELDVARDSVSRGSSDPAVSRAGSNTLMPLLPASSSMFDADPRHVTSVTSCRLASLATTVSNSAPFAQPPNYDKNMNIQPIRGHCKHRA